MAVGILGITYHLPERVESIEDLGRENPDWRIGKLLQKSGIRHRHIAAPDETASDLGHAAARKLLDRALVPPDEIDFIVYCTQSPDHYLPASACVLQERLGLGQHVGAFDFNQGCSGYVFGTALSKSLIDAGMARHVLLINADTYTKYIHPRDRTVRPLFGDAATATLLGPRDDGGFEQFVFGTDGAGAGNLIVPAGGLRLPRSTETAKDKATRNGCTRSADNLFMDGPAIFTFAMNTVPPTIDALLAKSHLTEDDIDWWVYHQATEVMLARLADRSNVPPAKMLRAFEDVGNTVSASIPIAIQRYVEAGRIVAGQRLLLVGFGVGYSWAACTLRWG